MAGSRYRPESQGTSPPATDRDDDPDLLTAIGYYGAGQLLVLGLPALWLLFLSSLDPTLLGPAVLTACAALPVSIAVGRRGLFGPDWPRLSNAKLGTGEDGGYLAFLRRAAHVCSTLVLAVLVGVLVGHRAGVPAAVVTTALLTVIGTALAVTFARPGRWRRLATAAYHATALGLVWTVVDPFASGLPSAAATTAVLALLGVVAVWRAPTAD
ncbi:hypothetical protein [Halorarius litoreus]|uniref:hypothetical protein n=1 Tax=Halorarius litoreus TaxID=2962676 RepID=UPI0020CB9865|nr:hypothetical protein [Halorarius litoreus]